MFDRAKFDAEMERLRGIPCLMNEEWELSEAMDKADASAVATESEPDNTA
jgi:hypothetical protein